MNQQLAQAIKYWHAVEPLLQSPKNHKGYNQQVKQLDALLDIVGSNENHPLITLVDALSERIAQYEAKHFPAAPSRGVDALKYLMTAQGLKQTDLSHLVSQGVLSEILNGKRQLNLNQIKLFAKYFSVNPETFIDD